MVQLSHSQIRKARGFSVDYSVPPASGRYELEQEFLNSEPFVLYPTYCLILFQSECLTDQYGWHGLDSMRNCKRTVGGILDCSVKQLNRHITRINKDQKQNIHITTENRDQRRQHGTHQSLWPWTHREREVLMQRV